MAIRKDKAPVRKAKTPAPQPASRQFDWADLKVFLAVAETGSLTNAAAQLGTTQPTVTRRIDELESRLGAKLLHRDTTGVTLTDTGRFVADHAASMARSAMAIVQEASMRDHVPAGEVTLSVPDALATWFLAPQLARFQRAYPEIRLEIRTRSEPLRTADISIQYQEAKRMEDVAVPLGWVHYVGFASKEYVELFGTPQSAMDAVNHKVLSHIDYTEQQDRWRSKMKPLQDLIDPIMQSDCAPFILSSVAAGAGVASMPSYCGLIDQRLAVVDDTEHARVRFWAVFDRERGELPRVRETINWLKSVFDMRTNPWFREEFIPPEEFQERLVSATGHAGEITGG
jgi:DNA-binding transcriptional LysR family regulator